MVLKEEQAAFSDWINNHLQADKDVSHLLLLNVSYCDKVTTLVNNIQETGSDLYEKMDDGILLCKMINLADKPNYSFLALSPGWQRKFLK